jgi:hypothetical protein
MGSRDARDVYETLRKSCTVLRPSERVLRVDRIQGGKMADRIAVLASHVHSPSEGSVLEPGAISFPESSFASVSSC